MDQDKMRNLYRGTSIDVSYQVSVQASMEVLPLTNMAVICNIQSYTIKSPTVLCGSNDGDHR
jgi:hypothetical protein